jgi:deoxyribodipyrimidine photolyase-like uncharacterized protein
LVEKEQMKEIGFYHKEKMTTLAFDTHEFVKELKDVGFSEQQAEVITKLHKAAISGTLEQARHDYEMDDLGYQT